MGFLKKFILTICLFTLLGTGVAHAANWEAFVVVKALGSEILLSDGYSYYLVDYSWECSSYDFSENEVIYIDTYYSPGWYDTILVDGLTETKTCTVSSSEELNLKDYYIENVIDSDDQIIVQGEYGDRYLLEYGYGCYSMWMYEDQYIQIDVSSSMLDGIGDTIYLFDSTQDCTVWDVEDLDSSSSYYNYYDYDSVSYNDSSSYSTTTIDSTAPEDSSAYIYSYTDSSKSKAVSMSSASSEASPYFEWYGITDDSTIAGYYVFFSDELDPEYSELEDSYQTSNAYQTPRISSNGDYYLVVYTVDIYGNVSDGIYWTYSYEEEVEVIDLAEEAQEDESNEEIFLDVGMGDPNSTAISYLKDNGVIGGYPDGTFRPEDSLNRAELLKILVEGVGITPDETQYSNCFPDVTTDWYAKYVCYAKEQNWIEGYLDGTFQPDSNVNKVEAIKMLLEVFDVETVDPSSSPYSDVPTSEWFAKYVVKAQELGLLEETTLVYSPDDDITRGGVSENIYRLLLQL